MPLHERLSGNGASVSRDDRTHRWIEDRLGLTATFAGQSQIWIPNGLYVYFDNDAKVRAPFDAITLESCAGDDSFGPGIVAYLIQSV
jgi:hypothetical protein